MSAVRTSTATGRESRRAADLGAMPAGNRPNGMPSSVPAVRLGSVDLRTAADGPIRAAHLTRPEPDARADHYVLDLYGWVVGALEPVQHLRLQSCGVTLDRVPVREARGDLPEHHPEHPWAASAGFHGALEVCRLPRHFEVSLFAGFEDGSEVELGRISGEWTPPTEVPDGYLQPLMLTSLGRTGSTWVTRLLGQHPQILAYDPFRAEPRAAGYWMGMYGAMAGERSYQRVLRAHLSGPHWWVGGVGTAPPRRPRDAMEDWLAREHASALLPLALERIEAFGRSAAELEDKGPGVELFCEKFGLDSFVQPLMLSLYPGAREVQLIRDPRDMITSMLAYNRAQGVPAFGRSEVDSDAAFVGWWEGGLRQMATEIAERADRAYVLRYEDLIREPAATLEALFGYLGVNDSEALVSAVIERAASGKVEAQRRHATASDPASSIGRWRNEFTPEMKRAAEALEPVVRALGYEP